MAKRPTLSLGPKARGKAQANRQLMKSALTPNTLQAQAAPAPFKAQNDPFASSPKSKAIYKSTERGRSTLIEDYSEFAQATASKNGRLGFWADGEDIFAELSGSTESIHSDTYISSQTTPEQIVASRLQAAGPDVAAAFLESAQQALGLRGVSHTGFSKSTNPAEKLVYMAGQGQIDLQDVAASLRSADREWGSPPPEDADVHEPDFFDQYKEAEQDRTPVSVKSPIDRALSVVGAMTVSHRRWKQQVDAPDLITPDLSTDLPTHMRSTHTEDKWSQKLFAANRAMGQLAQAYIDPSKIQGEELGETYEKILQRTTTVLNKLVPLKISDVGFQMATRGEGSAPIGWHQAMPTVAQVARLLPGSDRDFLVDKVNKMWTEDDDGKVSSPFTEAIKTIQEAYQPGDEGGLQKPKDFGYRGKAYLIDQLVASGRADPEQTVLSQDPARDQMYEFRVTNEPNELYDDALRALGVTHADTIGDEELQAKVARTAIRLRTGGTGTEVSEVRNLVSPLWEKDADLPQARRGEQPFPIELRPETIFAPFKHTGQASSSTRNAPAPAEAPKVGDVIQTAAEAKAEAFQATGDPVAAREKYFSERPWLQAIADDDDKHDPMSLWQRSRRGRVTSSTAGELSDPEQTQSAMRRLVEGALTDPKKPVKLGGQSIWTRSGDALEPLALDWYSKHIDANVFSPGLIYNRNKPGQATTPDAIADGGRRIVEVKSRNAFLDPRKIDMTTRQGRQDAETLRKNYAQVQHQMYLTGARSADLVEILRDVENPNLPKGKGGLDASNIRTRRIDRDDEMIQRMTPQWEAAGKAADQIANLKPSQQKMFAKAVEEGNIASFEKLTKKYGIDGGAALAATLGMTDEDSAGGGKSSSKGGGRNNRRAGGGGGGGRDFGGNFAGFGGRDAPTELRGGTRGLLSAMGPMGRAVNVGLTAAEIAWNTAQGLNDTGLNLSMSARSMGMSEKLFRDTRMDLASGRYVSLEAAQSDMSNIALAKGGLELGFVDRARQLVIGSRGALTIGDLQRADLNDPTTIRKLLGTMESRLKRRGVSDLGIAAAMEQTGLKSMAGAADVEEGRRKLNDSVVQISDAILSMELFAGGALGDISENGVTLIKTVQQGFTDVLGVLRGDPSNMANLDAEGRKPDGTTRDQRFGKSKLAALLGSEETDKEMYAEYLRKKGKSDTTKPDTNGDSTGSPEFVLTANNEFGYDPDAEYDAYGVEIPGSAAKNRARKAAEARTNPKSAAARAVYEYMGGAPTDWDSMSAEERKKFTGNIGTYSKEEQEKIINNLKGVNSGVEAYIPNMREGRMEVHLMTDGVAVITVDDSGQVTSQAFKPYVQGQRQ